MKTINEFCPKCKKLQMMDVSIVKKKDIDNDGKEKVVIIENHHCTRCNSFVRAEEREENAS